MVAKAMVWASWRDLSQRRASQKAARAREPDHDTLQDYSYPLLPLKIPSFSLRGGIFIISGWGLQPQGQGRRPVGDQV